MPANSSAKRQASPGLRKAAYASALIGGGVVGLDYATWLDLPPAIGALVGGIVSAILTGWLLHLQDDPEGEIRRACMALGALAGTITGVVVGMARVGGAEGFFGGAIGGVVLGLTAGQIVAALISLSAFCLLFISRGPVGLYLRNVVLQHSEEIGDLTSPATLLFEQATDISTLLSGIQGWLS